MRKPKLIKKNIFTNLFYFVTIFFILFVHIYSINKGLDFADTGWYLFNYKQARLLQNQDITRFFSWYLGSFFYFETFDYGLLMLRIINKVFMLVSYFTLYFLFKNEKFDVKLIFLIFIGSIFSLKYPLEISYNTFSMTILLVTFFLLIRMNDTKYKDLLIGILFGLSVFFRLPNLLAPSLFMIFYFFHNKEYTFKFFKYLLLGLLLSILIIIYILGFDDFISKFYVFSNQFIGKSEYSTHSFFGLIYNLVYQFLSVVYLFPYIAFMIFIGSTFFLDLLKIPFNVLKILKTVFVLIFCIYIIYTTNLSIIIWFFTLVGLIRTLTLWLSTKDKRFLMIFSIILTFIVGTDNGFNQAYLVMPIVFIGVFYRFGQIETRSLSHKFIQSIKKTIKKIIGVYDVFLVRMIQVLMKSSISILFILVLFSMLFQLKNISYGESNINLLTEKMDIKPFKGIYTSVEKYNLLFSIENQFSTTDINHYKLIIFGNFPIGFSLMNSQSYFSESWSSLDTIFSFEDFNHQLSKYNNESLIIIIFNDTAGEKKELLKQFIEKNKFEIYNSNEEFTTYIKGQ